jgi:hypothetical protein
MKRLIALGAVLLLTACSSVQFVPGDIADLGKCHVQNCNSMSIHEHIALQ